MDQLNKHHKSKTQNNKYKCDKTNKELTYETYHYDNTPQEFVPLLINAINELKERISILENKLVMGTESKIDTKVKKPLNL
jgi:hypothetical protein